jgi:anti-sigma factor RsiW
MARTAAPPAPQGEHHLGDRLAAFVDGELDHDARERVQSHLATCDACLSRAEDERRIKNRIAAAAPPDPSALFLSKLMSIAPDRDDRPPSGPQPRRGFGGLGGAAFGGSAGGVFGAGGSSSFGSGRFGSGALGAEHPLPGVDPRAERGMQPREESRPIAARLRAGLGPAVDPSGRPSASPRPVAAPAAVSSTPRPSAARGRRFAFAAAGAFSVAAVALGSAITGVTAAEPTVDEPYGSVTPAVDVPAGGFDYVSDTSRLAAAGVPVNASGFGADYSFQQSNGLLRASTPVASATSLPGADQQVLHSAIR